MLNLLGDFIGELRAAGIPVSMSEHVDAARAVEVIDLGDRSLLRATLAATLVKDGDHLPVFYTAFDVYFSIRSWDGTDDLLGDELDLRGETRDGAPGANGQGPRGRGGGGGSMSAAELAEMLFRALRDGDLSALRAGASEAVTRYAGVEPGRPVGGTYYLYRTLRNLELDRCRRASWASPLGGDELSRRRWPRTRPGSRIEQLKAEIEREIRERLVEDRGAEALAKSVRKPLPEDLDVMHANRDEMAQLERALRPLSRKLAVRLARKRRRRRRGPVDLRHTVRRSLSTGGVPIDLRFKPPRPAKPEIFVIADMSGSVASFARFTLHLVHAISSQFSKVRSSSSSTDSTK